MTPTEMAAARQKANRGRPGRSAAGRQQAGRVAVRGAVHHLYTYKVYSDVRLVFGVEVPDRLLRRRRGQLHLSALQPRREHVPALRERQAGRHPELPAVVAQRSADGELVFTTGHPGSTQRLNTLAHFKYRRDLALPFSVASLEMREAAVKKWMALTRRTPDWRRPSCSASRTAEVPARPAERPPGSDADRKKEASEKRLRAELAKNPAKQQELGDAWTSSRSPSAWRARSTRAQLHRECRDPELDAVRPGAPDGSRGLLPAGAGGRRARAGARAGGRPAHRRGRGGAQSAINLGREKLNLTESLALHAEVPRTDHAIVKRILAASA